MRRLVVLFSLLAAVHVRGATVRVSAGSSLTDVLQELARTYQTETGDRVVFNFGSSGTLARPIIEGAPVDVIISADERQMDRVAGRGFIVGSTRRPILSNTLVVIVPKDSTITLKVAKDLAADDVARIAIGDPETVPAGLYSREYLRRAGLWNEITRKLIPLENVRAALAAVEAGNVDAGLVYKSDAMISRLVRTAFELHGPPEISYPGAVVSTSRNRAAAKRYLDSLSSPAAKAVFEKYGFIVK